MSSDHFSEPRERAMSGHQRDRGHSHEWSPTKRNRAYSSTEHTDHTHMSLFPSVVRGIPFALLNDLPNNIFLLFYRGMKSPSSKALQRNRKNLPSLHAKGSVTTSISAHSQQTLPCSNRYILFLFRPVAFTLTLRNSNNSLSSCKIIT